MTFATMPAFSSELQRRRGSGPLRTSPDIPHVLKCALKDVLSRYRPGRYEGLTTALTLRLAQRCEELAEVERECEILPAM
jgi:hypothetical protein